MLFVCMFLHRVVFMYTMETCTCTCKLVVAEKLVLNLGKHKKKL